MSYENYVTNVKWVLSRIIIISRFKFPTCTTRKRSFKLQTDDYCLNAILMLYSVICILQFLFYWFRTKGRVMFIHKLYKFTDYNDNGFCLLFYWIGFFCIEASGKFKKQNFFLFNYKHFEVLGMVLVAIIMSPCI